LIGEPFYLQLQKQNINEQKTQLQKRLPYQKKAIAKKTFQKTQWQN
jgi:hypothetical protein